MHWLWFIVAGYVGLCLLLMWREPDMIFLPHRQLEATPAQAGWAFEEVRLTTRDGVLIHGWWVPAPNATRTVLFFHGNAGNISHRLEKLGVLRELGANVLLLDYRGYGASTGKPSEAGLYRDADAAYAFLTGTKSVPAPTIVFYGESLGTGVAVELATRQAVGGVVLEAPFTSMADVGREFYPFLPVRWLVRNKFENLAKIGRIHAPLLLLHSRQDEIFSFRHAERLLAAAQEPKRLVELSGGHNDSFSVSAAVYRQALHEFLGGDL
jgi:hypothetical protein